MADLQGSASVEASNEVERARERRAGGHLRDLLASAAERWQLALDAAERGDAQAAEREHSLTQEGLDRLGDSYELWFDSFGALADVSPEAAAIAGEMTTAFKTFLEQRRDPGRT